MKTKSFQLRWGIFIWTFACSSHVADVFDTDTEDQTESDGVWDADSSLECAVNSDPLIACSQWEQCRGILGVTIYGASGQDTCESWRFVEDGCQVHNYMRTICENIGSTDAQCTSVNIDIDFGTDFCPPPFADADKACLPENQCSVLTPEALYEDWQISVYDPPIDIEGYPEDLGCSAYFQGNATFYYECFKLGTPDAACYQSLSVGC